MGKLNTIKQKIKENKIYQKYIKRHWSYWKSIRRIIKNIVLHGAICSKLYFHVYEKKIIYIRVTKAACSSIKASLFDINLKNENDIAALADYVNIKDPNMHFLESKSFDSTNFYKFTYVRNPFARLVSCYKHRLDEEKGVYFQKQSLRHLRNLGKDEGFEAFVKKIYKIPVPFMDKHFYPQYNYVYDKKGNCMADYIGKFEDLPNDYNGKIADVYGFKHLPHYNKTGSGKRWEDYYTVETANLVYKKYKKDFEVFGYEESYKELTKYLNKRHLPVNS